MLDDTDTEPDKAQASAPAWRDVIKVHPAANLFPMMTAAELKMLGEDIKKNGMAVPVVFWADKDGREFLLDGRNRLDAMERIGLPVVDTEGRLHVPLRCRAAVDPYEYVLSANIHRRHLTPEQKREIIAKVVKAQPEKSNRTIAKQVKVDHKTVGTVRAKLEAGGEIPHHDLREDARGTKQPAHKPPPKPPPVSEEMLQQRAAAAERTRALMGGKTRDDIGPDSTGKAEPPEQIDIEDDLAAIVHLDAIQKTYLAAAEAAVDDLSKDEKKNRVFRVMEAFGLRIADFSDLQPDAPPRLP